MCFVFSFDFETEILGLVWLFEISCTRVQTLVWQRHSEFSREIFVGVMEVFVLDGKM